MREVKAEIGNKSATWFLVEGGFLSEDRSDESEREGERDEERERERKSE